MKTNSAIKTIIYASCFLTVTACSTTSDPTKFYSLPTIVNSSQDTSNTIGVHITSVEIPRLIDRQQIVSRKHRNEIVRAKHHLWGGEFREEIENTIIEGLSYNLNTNAISLQASKQRNKSQFNLSIKISRLDGVLGDKTYLNVSWKVLDNKDHREINNRVVISKNTLDDSYYSYTNSIAAVIKEAMILISNDINNMK